MYILLCIDISPCRTILSYILNKLFMHRDTPQKVFPEAAHTLQTPGEDTGFFRERKSLGQHSTDCLTTSNGSHFSLLVSVGVLASLRIYESFKEYSYFPRI